ncbi:hypothetical protein L211DRAFT_644091 [Terfezia boudieri ATCC MYA-4762]|uniref:Uncharacterized protein n=1 Tax=Terfezia boudieri ATCC MYA-4762 TaxID=1051890 RepID=A0A3N4LUN3_9PEZI|nr:hypothetical protein L211DRAFT_644091 [Terfezia boudieri ATCC MYA-4762]
MSIGTSISTPSCSHTGRSKYRTCTLAAGSSAASSWSPPSSLPSSLPVASSTSLSRLSEKPFTTTKRLPTSTKSAIYSTRAPEHEYLILLLIDMNYKTPPPRVKVNTSLATVPSRYYWPVVA